MELSKEEQELTDKDGFSIWMEKCAESSHEKSLLGASKSRP